MALPRGSTLPGSRRSELLRVLQGAASRGPAQWTFREILDLYGASHRTSFASHDRLSSAIGALIHDGILRRRPDPRPPVVYDLNPGDRRSSKRRIPAVDVLARNAARLVAKWYAETGGAVATREISAGLRERGLWPDRFARLFRVLEQLEAAGHIRRVATRSYDPDTPTRNGTGQGRKRGLRTASALPKGEAAFWVPASAPPLCCVRPADAAEAVRRVVAAAARAAGRPVSLRELRWWVAAFSPSDGGTDQLPEHLAHTLRLVVWRSVQTRRRTGAIAEVRGPLTCHGGAPPRFALLPTRPLARYACRMQDAASMLRAKSELESIADLRAATASRDRTMQAWLRLRSRLISHACRAHAGPDPERAASMAARALTVIERWGGSPASGSEMARAQHRLEIESSRGNIRAARLALGTSAGRRKGWPDRPRGVGEASIISPHDARLLVASLDAFGELPLRHPENAYRGARRFPVRASRDIGRAAHGGDLLPGDALSVLDRVDVLTSVVQRVDAPVANLLVGRAHALIGHVVRDKAAIRRLVEDLGRHPTTADEPRLLDAIVALGLLGAEPLEPDHWTDASADRARAHVLALALATLDRRRTLGVLRDTIQRRQAEMPAPARGVFVGAVQALRTGALIGLLEAHPLASGRPHNAHGSD